MTGVDGPAPARERLRALPAVDRLAAGVTSAGGGAHGGPPRPRPTAAARAVLAARRAELLAGARDEPDLVARALAHLRPSLRRVLNATGVVLHTNLGRAPLAPAAADAARDAALGYVNLELDLSTGRRGRRDAHVRGLLTELTGAEDALVVNNGAAATLLAAAALAGPGGAIVVSRGQLVEIGGGFRVPDVVAQAGARLIEVGTTNRTRLADYERALAEAPDASSSASIPRTSARSGSSRRSASRRCAASASPSSTTSAPASWPAVWRCSRASHRSAAPRAAGAAVVCCSADKLLGGPQGGLLVGRGEAVAACRRHPLARALRIGRLPMAALAATLALHRDPARALREVPVLAMLTVPPDVLRARAERLAAATGGELVEAVARVGGGALPLVELPGPAVALGAPGADPQALAAALRAGDPPLLARIADGRVLADPRTLAADELDLAAAAVRAALGAVPRGVA